MVHLTHLHIRLPFLSVALLPLVAEVSGSLECCAAFITERISGCKCLLFLHLGIHPVFFKLVLVEVRELLEYVLLVDALLCTMRFLKTLLEEFCIELVLDLLSHLNLLEGCEPTLRHLAEVVGRGLFKLLHRPHLTIFSS